MTALRRLGDVRRALIIRRRALGDALVSLPLVERPCAALPDAEVDLPVGTDNGARHLAALMGTPTVTLYGSTDPAAGTGNTPCMLGSGVPWTVFPATCGTVRCPGIPVWTT